jgi:hypothetical protein
MIGNEGEEGKATALLHNIGKFGAEYRRPVRLPRVCIMPMIEV